MLEVTVKRVDTLLVRVSLHLGGLLVLAIAWLSLRAMMDVARPGNEPALTYLLALTTFLLASSGMALAVMGRRLFQKVIVSDRWLPHVPIGFVEAGYSTARSPRSSSDTQAAMPRASDKPACDTSIST
jgi:hypothetical protein